MNPLRVLAGIVWLGSVSQAAPQGMIPPLKRDLKFAFGSEKIRGVNLGGWLVLEPWITPSFFEVTPDNVVDEYTLTQTLGADESSTRLEQHWSTWITADDFSDIASKGLNFVRIPVGYWSVTPLSGDPYVDGGYKYLGMALDWAGDNDLKVMIDLHGAPGSQNGLDNSGRRGAISWTQGDTVSQTLTALNKLRDDFASHPAVASIELLNEPMSPNLNMDTVRQFMTEGVNNLQGGANIAIAFHDAFLGPTSWNDWGAASASSSLLLDTHHYEVFDNGQLQMSVDQHVSSACGFGGTMATSNKWTISGEFSGAMTDCAKWLNGRGVGARYDGTFNYNGQSSTFIAACDGKSPGSVDNLAEAERTNIANFITAQMVAYEKAAGWIFWTWKTESAPEWSFKDLANAGIIPQPLSSMNTAVCG
ncbi:glucan 1,3-beta-glucosidase precursor [Hypoxylon rubiginosum]|uniref:Glucan 1,3-beta-glucosidase n=1 Tax=Hypoxylon rubiginosum TaxID=110542 RepID=A0ACC0CQU8_9PEZI|nr:glucan 1,3-beta-glucosidase precursor [Hypoxylon rubiginosum]